MYIGVCVGLCSSVCVCLCSSMCVWKEVEGVDGQAKLRESMQTVLRGQADCSWLGQINCLLRQSQEYFYIMLKAPVTNKGEKMKKKYVKLIEKKRGKKNKESKRF